MQNYTAELINNDMISIFNYSFWKKDIEGDTMINGEKYKSLNKINYMIPLNGLGSFLSSYQPPKQENSFSDNNANGANNNLGNNLKSDNKIIKEICEEIHEEIEEKKKRGRPRKENIITNDDQKRKNIVQVEYMKRRYHNDSEYREKCKEKNRAIYAKIKEEKKFDDIINLKKEIKSLYNKR